jgi:hypothetical protein
MLFAVCRMFETETLDKKTCYQGTFSKRSSHEATRHVGISVNALAMKSRLNSFANCITPLVIVIALLTSPIRTLAQRGGGGGGGRGMMSTGMGNGGVVGARPDGVNEADDIKAFHHAMAVQATAEQRAAFGKIAQYSQSAIDQLTNFRKLQMQAVSTPLSERATTVGQAIQQARASNQNFLLSFSSEQKSGLEDTAKKLEKVDSELDKEFKVFDQLVHGQKPDIEPVTHSIDSLDKALDNFQEEQLALGREMSILFPSPGQGVTFSLPPVTNAITVAGQPITIPASGAVVSHSSAENSGESSGQSSAEISNNLFGLKLVDDLSDVQQNVTAILRSELKRPPRCGERVDLQQATLTPFAPASLVIADLHIERWICPPGQQTAVHVADANATIEVKLIPSIASDKGLGLSSEITRVEADGFFRDMLRTGDLGKELREQITAALLPVLQKGADLKSALPPVAEQSAKLQKVQFQDDGADQMSLVFDGRLELSEAQAQQFAAQLKQRLAAQGATPP